jgi:colanic acid biosynthesis glycosyl transferase WcaI
MHFLLLNQYYPPDAAPTGVMLEALAEALANRGHRVTIVCAPGGYAGTAGNSKAATAADLASSAPTGVSDHSPSTGKVLVQRIGATAFGRGSFLGKLTDYFSYYLCVAWKLMTMHPAPERVIALTTPPYLSVLARLGSRIRGADHAHWVMDLYPDVMVAHGMLPAGGLAHRLLSSVAAFGFGGKRCVGIITLGPDMADRVKAHLPFSDQVVEWVPLWGTDPEASSETIPDPLGSTRPTTQALRHRRGWADDEVVVMYSGNMGLGHRFEEVLEAAQLLTAPRDRSENPALDDRSQELRSKTRFRFVFYGGGKRRSEVEKFLRDHPECRVELHDYAPAEELAEHLRSADVHLASLAPEWTGTMVPSKLQGIFAAGRPVIFIGDVQSSIGTWVEKSGGGWLVPPGDLPQLLAALAESAIATNRIKRGTLAAAFAREHFTRARNVDRIACLLDRSSTRHR